MHPKGQLDPKPTARITPVCPPMTNARRPSLAAEQLVRRLTEEIAAGRLVSGQKIPSIRQMAASLRISFHAVVCAYERLEAQGSIRVQSGLGYFVSAAGATLPECAKPLPKGPLDPHGIKAFWQLFHGNDQCLKLGCGWLPAAWRDTQALARVVRRTANFAHSSLVDYGDPAGYLPLRQKLVSHLQARLGVALAPDHLLTTLGATQALDLIIRLHIEPGDRVLVDDPCNSNLVQLLKLRGAIILGIPRRHDGPDMRALAERLQDGKVKAFFLNSRLHNPTGTSLSDHGAFRLLQLANQHDLLLVEDDVYGDFCSAGHSRLVALDGLHKVIYIGSFSKSLSANLRVGYIVAPPAVIQPLADLKLLTSVAVPGFCERFVSAMLADGSYERHLRRVRRRLQTAQATAQKHLLAWGWELFHAPTEGMFLWARHPQLPCLEAFIEAGAQQGILLAPATLFSAQGEDGPWLRINVAHFQADQARPQFYWPKTLPVSTNK
jgi:DNA-binding transcriptional MocR family regulator